MKNNHCELSWRFVFCTVAGVLMLIMASSGTFAHAQKPEGFTKLSIGDPAPNFDLPGVDDKNHTLASFADSKVLMIVFTCNHCPTAQAYESRLNQLVTDYSDKGFALVAISPNDPLAVRLDELGYSDLGDSLDDMKVRAKEAKFKFPYLYDGENQKVSLSYGAIATPHVFIFDSARKLRYQGRIDDSESGNAIKSADAKNAIDAILDGEKVPVEKTRVFGCSTKWISKRQSAKDAIKRWSQEPVEINVASKDDIKTLAANDTDKYRLINVWATWCAPCVKELPELVTINRMYRGRNFEMITISTDTAADKEKALKVLTDKQCSSKNLLFESEKRDDLFDNLDAESEGGVPYTVLIAPGGEVVHRQHSSIDAAELKRIIVGRIGRTFGDDK